MTVEAIPAAAPEPVVPPAEPIATDPIETGTEETGASPATEAEAAPEPAPKRTPWFEARIAKLTAEKHELAQQIARLQTKPADPADPAIPERTYTQTEVDAMADARARFISAENEFAARCNEVYNKAVDAFSDFKEVLGGYSKIGGLTTPEGRALIEAALETDEPHKVLYELGKDLDRAAQLTSLSPVRMAAAVAKYAASLDKPAAASKAPAPIKPITGAAAPTLDPEKIPIAEWIRLRNEGKIH